MEKNMVNSNIISLNKHKEQSTLDKLLDVYIQDPAKNCGYLITAETLVNKHLSKDSVSGDYITFVIPDFKSITTAVPVFQQTYSETSAIRIHDLASKTDYIISRDELNGYIVELNEFNPHGISFIMPIKSELIEELPAMARGLLQVGEWIIHHNKVKEPVPAIAK